MKKNPTRHSFSPTIAAVGGSAGSLDAFQELLEAIGGGPGIAIVWVQHLDPDGESQLTELLTRTTPMKVVEISGRCEVEIDTIYVCPPQALLTLENGFLAVSSGDERNGTTTPIDHFFNTVAEDLGERAIGVILSGSGSDGTLGLKAISDHGGLTFAQDSASAKFDSMPRSAATTGAADHVLRPSEMAKELQNYVRYLCELQQPQARKDLQDDIRQTIPAIAERLMQPDQLTELAEIRQRITLDEFAPKSVVIDEEGKILDASPDMQKYLTVSGGDYQNSIFKMAHRGLRIGLRAAISEAKQIRRRVHHEDLSLRVGDQIQRVMLTVQPMPRVGESEPLFMVVFQDVGLPVQCQALGQLEAVPDPQRNDEAIVVQLDRELETTREDLDRTLQDIEASNEELKSSNEELLSVNEELQSTNEELETSKEEIRASSDAIARANNDLENLLRSTQIATVFLDEKLCIRSFTPSVQDIYDLIPTDLGRPLERFVPNVADMPGLPNPQNIQDGDCVEHTIITHSGRSYIRRVLPYPSYMGQNEGIVVTFTDVSQLTESRLLFELLVKASARIVWVTDANGIVTEDSPSWRDFTGQSVDQWMGLGWLEVLHPDDREPTLTTWKAKVASGEPLSIEYRLLHRDGDYRWTRANAVTQRNLDGSIKRWIGMNTDIDQQKRDAVEMASREAHLRRVIDHTMNFVGVLSPDGILLEANATAVNAGGFNRDDVIGKPFWQCPWWNYDQAVADQLRANIQRARLGEVMRYDVEIRLAGDARATIDFMLVPAKNDDGVITHLIPSGVDISDRHATEQRLHDNERRASMALEAGGMAAWEWTSEKCVWDPKLFELIGISPTDNPTPDIFFNVVHPDDLPALQAIWRRATEGDDEYRTEFRVLRRDGQTRWLAAVGMVKRDEDGTVASIHGLNWDITERKEAENRIRASEERLRLTLQAAELRLWQWSVHDDEWLWSGENSAPGDLTGLEHIGGLAEFLTQVHPEDREVVEATLRQSLEAGQPYRHEYRVERSGEYRWVMSMAHPSLNDLNSPLQLIGVELDMTDRRKVELQARDQTKRLAMALKAGDMAAWEWTPTGSVWTDNLYEMLGIANDQPATVELLFAHVHPEDLSELHEAWQIAVNKGSDFEHEFRIVRPDGENRWMVGVGEAIRNRNGNVVRLCGLNWDATDEHLTAERLRESERAALAASESKSAFVANMSHEIRTPMTAILGYADLIRDLIDDNEALSHLQTIRRNGDYLLTIINDILDLSKIEAGKLEVECERFQPAKLIEDVRSVMSVRASEGGLSLDVEYDGKLPKLIESDAKRLKQILINLIGNAIKFTHEGRVKIRVRFEGDAQLLHFDIVDTGIGMNNEQQQRLFKPFSQGDASVTRNFGGTGLGLAISQRIAGMLGGEIVASSTEGVGSTFTVTIATGDLQGIELIDYAAPVDREPFPSEPTEKTQVQLSCHVLVVDDRRDIRFLSKQLLTQAGATVDECEDGLLAVKHMTGCLGKENCPDIILLDMQMPNLDGYQTARKLRELGYTGPIVALTADAMQGDMNECLEAGCNDYLSKPIDAQRLVELVGELTGKRSV